MKIGVVGDSHGNLNALKKAVKQMGAVDVIFHLGDYVEDGLYLKTLTDAPVHIIKGNMDQHAENGSSIITTTIGGFKFFACHGHQYGVKNDLNNVYHAGLEKNAEVILFGHSHKAFLQDDGQILIMNPGSVGAPRMGDPESYGIITIENGDIDAKIFPVSDYNRS